jgi:hypothetical protein
MNLCCESEETKALYFIYNIIIPPVYLYLFFLKEEQQFQVLERVLCCDRTLKENM